jgi:hypothetical protein
MSLGAVGIYEFVFEKLSLAISWVVDRAWVGVIEQGAYMLIPAKMPRGFVKKTMYVAVLTILMHSFQEGLKNMAVGAITSEKENELKREIEQLKKEKDDATAKANQREYRERMLM